MIKYFINKYRFYKEQRRVKKLFKLAKNVVLLPSVHLDIRLSKKECGQIGEKSIVGCNFVFESSEGYISIGKRTYIGGAFPLRKKYQVCKKRIPHVE